MSRPVNGSAPEPKVHWSSDRSAEKDRENKWDESWTVNDPIRCRGVAMLTPVPKLSSLCEMSEGG